MERSAGKAPQRMRGKGACDAGVLVFAVLTTAAMTVASVQTNGPTRGQAPAGAARGQAPSEPARRQAPPAPAGETGSEPAAGGRLLPPTVLPCTRDHLTSYSGRILVYKRSPERIFIRMRTDESTTESFTLALTKGEDPAKWFLLQGAPFRPEAWARVERGPGRLHEGMRAIVWLCREGSKQPLIDWRPGEGEEQAEPRPR